MKKHFDYVYFVISPKDIRGLQRSLNAIDMVPMQPDSDSAYADAQFPLHVGLAVTVNAPSTSVQASFEGWCHPSGLRLPICVLEGGWITELVMPDVFFDGKRIVEIYEPSLESILCRYTETILPSGVMEQVQFGFITNLEGMKYQRFACEIDLKLNCWEELADWQIIWQARRPPRLERRLSTDFDRIWDAIDADCELKEREELELKAAATGPNVGSVIPCSLYWGRERLHSNCVCEIRGINAEFNRASGVIHVLADATTIDVFAGLRVVFKTNCIRESVAAWDDSFTIGMLR